MHWLAGKSGSLADWSPYSMGPVLDQVEQLFERAAHDGRVLLNPALHDPKSPSYLWASLVASQPKFREYLLEHMYTKDVSCSPDLKTKHMQYEKALKELLTPSDDTNQRSTDLTVEYSALRGLDQAARRAYGAAVVPQVAGWRSELGQVAAGTSSRGTRTQRAARRRTTSLPSRALRRVRQDAEAQRRGVHGFT
eukprot:7216113-Prymnesium_polylepis.1